MKRHNEMTSRTFSPQSTFIAYRFLAVIVLAVFLDDAFAIGTKSCNLIQTCSHVSAAIQTLETKLENLIALVNKTRPPQPTPKRKTLSLLI